MASASPAHTTPSALLSVSVGFLFPLASPRVLVEHGTLHKVDWTRLSSPDVSHASLPISSCITCAVSEHP